MKKTVLLLGIMLLGIHISLIAQSEEVTIKLVHTSDVHGSFFPYDFINDSPMKGSLSRVEAYMKEIRRNYPQSNVLLDGGDILQGQPTVYYYNYIDTLEKHLCARIMNYMNYDVSTLGNHDIEAGHEVYDRWMVQLDFPVTAANIIDKDEQSPYCLPYTIIEKEGVRMAVLGMITPSIPAWLPEVLWSGLQFEDMKRTAEKWVPYIQEKEKPDVLIGLFHTGVEPYILSGLYNENAAVQVAQEVPGFDIVFCGHDHSAYCEKLPTVSEGDSVWVLNPANQAKYISEVTLKVKKEAGKVLKTDIVGQVLSMDTYEPDLDYMNTFGDAMEKVKTFVSSPIGTMKNTISTREAFFGSSSFVDLIHQLQLDISGADISIAAPLSFNATIHKGKIYVRDMFNLYRFENMLYTMEFSGAEIKGALEESYRIWTNQMHTADDHLLLIEERKNGSWSFLYPSFNFDSAAGILYTVDVTKPEGEKITIKSLADGRPFEMSKKYKVALNSYRGNGGGELFTKGAGITQDELKNRIISSTEKDLRFYLMEEIKQQQVIDPQPLNHWQFIPSKFIKKASAKDYKLLFPKNKK